MDGSTTNLDGDEGVEAAYSSLKRCQVGIFIREDPKVARFYA